MNLIERGVNKKCLFFSSGNFFKNGTTESGNCRSGAPVDNGDEVMGEWRER